MTTSSRSSYRGRHSRPRGVSGLRQAFVSGTGPVASLSRYGAVGVVAGGVAVATALSASATVSDSGTVSASGAFSTVSDPTTAFAAMSLAEPAPVVSALSALSAPAVSAASAPAHAVAPARDGVLGFTATSAAKESVMKVSVAGGAAAGRAASRSGGRSSLSVSSYNGLSGNAAAVIAAVRANFPSISTIGTLRGGGGDHGSGHACDIMTSDVALGTAIADYMRAHASQLGISYVIWRQRIWSVQRSGEGWRFMSDRGSSTANHYDHVHVSVS